MVTPYPISQAAIPKLELGTVVQIGNWAYEIREIDLSWVEKPKINILFKGEVVVKEPAPEPILKSAETKGDEHDRKRKTKKD